MCCLLPLYVTYFPTVMVRYSLFVLKVPLNPKQTKKQTYSSKSIEIYVYIEISLIWQGW